MELLCKFSLEDDFSSPMYSLSAKLLNFFVQSLEDTSNVEKCLLWHQSQFVTKVLTSSPWETIPERLTPDGICYYSKSFHSCCISDILLLTDILGYFAGIPIHARALVESDHNRTESVGCFRVAMTLGV